MNYLFRLPKFPVLVDAGDRLVYAKTRAQLEGKLSKISLVGEESRHIIDATAEGFALYPKTQAIAPSISIRRWTKQQIIDLYNQRRETDAPELSNTSLGNRSLQRIVVEVVELLAQR